MPLTQNTLPNVPYVDGFQLSLASTGASVPITVGPGSCLDNTQTNAIVLSSQVSIIPTNVGVNGLDTGSLANDTLYYIYVISDSTDKQPTAAILSKASLTGNAYTDLPVFPFGYDSAFRIGACRTDGSAHILQFTQRGCGQMRTTWYGAPQGVLLSGSATSDTAVHLAGYIPAQPTNVYLNGNITPNSAGNTLTIGPFSGYLNKLTVSGPVVSVMQIGQGLSPTSNNVAGVIDIFYKVSNGSDVANIYVIGYQDLLIP